MIVTYGVQHSAAGDGRELTAPDAVVTVKVDTAHTDGMYEVLEVHAPRLPATPLHRTGWAKTYYVLQGRMVVQVDDEAYDVSAGAAVSIPPYAAHTFTVLSPSATFLVMSLGDAMSSFLADLDATVPHGRPVAETLDQLQEVLGRHDVAVATAGTGPG